MCDTLVAVHADGIAFAKNSDREPVEPQNVEWHPAASNDAATSLRCTHIEISQVADRNAVILSRPQWLDASAQQNAFWGAEMGINEHGVVIGNEAVFSRSRTLEPGLLGMDLLRLGLERADSAEAALDCIAQLLEAHGQGGTAGFRDHQFHYDSSFIIADAREAWVLETAGRHWVAKQLSQTGSSWSISNRYSITTDFDRHSEGLHEFAASFGWKSSEGKELDFAAVFDSKLLPHFARSAKRQGCSRAQAEAIAAANEAPTLERLALAARQHAKQNEAPLAGSNADVCQHAAGTIRRSQTTGSMLALLKTADFEVAFTGTSAPCLSVFRPIAFADAGESWSLLGSDLWQRFEPLHQRALHDAGWRRLLRDSRDVTQSRVWGHWLAGNPQHADSIAEEWLQSMEAAFTALPPKKWGGRAGRWWRKQLARV